MGRYMAAELIESGFFQGIDVIIPIPLHETKQRIRGYNQSEWIARGIAAVTGIPVDTEAVVRRKYTETQTRKSIFERWENVEGIFELHHAESLIGKHHTIRGGLLPEKYLQLGIQVHDHRYRILLQYGPDQGGSVEQPGKDVAALPVKIREHGENSDPLYPVRRRLPLLDGRRDPDVLRVKILRR